MPNNFFPLSAEELVKRINKIPKVNLATLPTALEYMPNISKELEINLYIKRDDPINPIAIFKLEVFNEGKYMFLILNIYINKYKTNIT